MLIWYNYLLVYHTSHITSYHTCFEKKDASHFEVLWVDTAWHFDLPCPGFWSWSGWTPMLHWFGTWAAELGWFFEWWMNDQLISSDSWRFEVKILKNKHWPCARTWSKSDIMELSEVPLEGRPFTLEATSVQWQQMWRSLILRRKICSPDRRAMGNSELTHHHSDFKQCTMTAIDHSVSFWSPSTHWSSLI